MRDRYGRKIEYLRLSVTDRCNLRCRYCMPEEGVPGKDHGSMMSYEEIERLLRLMLGMGLRRVRITGGEPLVRKGLVSFIGRIAALPGLDDLSLSTNGLRLAGMARDLRAAGVSRVNISLDTLRPCRFALLTRRDGHRRVLEGIDAALQAGMAPVKLNCVVIRGFNDDELASFAELTRRRPLHVRFIELMPLGDSSRLGGLSVPAGGGLVPVSEIRCRLEKEFGDLEPAPLLGGGPAKSFRIAGAAGTVGFISAMSQHFCGGCNRIRLTADGKLNPCLGSLAAVDLLGRMRSGAADSELLARLSDAVRMKPARHHMDDDPGGEAAGRRMSAIGG